MTSSPIAGFIAPSPGTAARHSHRSSCGRADGNPAARYRCACAVSAISSLPSSQISWPNRLTRPAGRPQRQEQQAQQRGLAGAGGTGQELERMRRDLEIEVAQNLRAKPVAQTNIFEPDHIQLRSMGSKSLKKTVNCLCGRYGFRFVNGRLVACRPCHRLSAPCISFAPIARRPTP